MKTKIAVYFFLFALYNLSGQTIRLNKLWQTNNANPTTNEQIGCGVSPSGSFVYFTNHKPTTNCDMSLNCICPTGTITWQNNCGSCPTTDDYGSDVAFDASGNIYVCGAKSNTANLDYFVAKYSATGTLIWSQIYNGTGNKDDAAADIELDASGNIYVTGSSYGTFLPDAVTIKYNNSGVQQWLKRYDNSNLPDVGVGLKLDNSGNVFVLGSSFNTTNDADYIVIKYDPATGNQIGFIRHTTTGLGYDMPSEMVIDANNKLYITGTSVNGANKNIKTLALTNSLTTMWVKYIDKAGKADEGFGITVNSSSDIVVAGYSQKSNNGTNFLVEKYNSASGSTIWSYTRPASLDNKIAKARKVQKDNFGNLIIAGEIDGTSTRDFYILGLNQNGKPIWEKQYNNGNGSNSVRNLVVTPSNEIFVNGISDNGSSKQVTTLKLAADSKTDSSKAVGSEKFVDDELVIQFDIRYIEQKPFLSKDIQFGELQEFINPSVIKKMDSIIPIEGGWGRSKASKVFPNMTLSDSLSLNGDSVWVNQNYLIPTLLVDNRMSDEKLYKDSLNKLYPYLRYSELNHTGISFLSTNPNDNFYQSGQFTGYTSATNGINLPNAWQYTTGSPLIKIGVYDTGINFFHEDFGGGTFATSKLSDGKNYISNVATSTETSPDVDGHGTACAGIIGALSNNAKGVSGVAGGDVAAGNVGCLLQSMRLGSGVNTANASTIANAIVEGVSYNPFTGFGYNLDVTNHSYGVQVNNLVINQAVGTSYINSSIFVAASGNFPSVTPIDAQAYPASYFDDGVLKVGANDGSGDRAAFSVYDNNLDLIAPGTNDQYICVDFANNSNYVDNFDGSSVLYPNAGINGTSFSAPMAAGVAGLMMSVHNTTIGATANLFPEDVEKLMCNAAKDVNAVGYDKFTGFGRLDAAKAVSSIFYPRYRIIHPTPQSASWTQGLANTQVVVANNTSGVSAGVYFAQRHHVNWAYSVLLPVGFQILDWWERTSSETGVDAAVPITGQLSISLNVIASGSNFMIWNATTNCWNITGNIIGQTMNSWIPAPPSGLNAAYSIYAFDPSVAIGVTENTKVDSEFNLYPNPTTSQINIEYGNVEDKTITLEVIDAIGKHIIKTDYKTAGTTGITIDLSYLRSGVYFCKIIGSNFSITKRFVKID